ncbi:DUF2752 domain-containing protein [Mucilaginibacter boryungensis]|uniref:DUF2752 domain-containing protein n=1 Tax=Mucilaginibacter boryungensis TaxID=768480 RepID=A0ABR9XIL5_9SPHI|nr:DUF2752 domain-containing protein [Mucilaginibacter boryungensis]MBE9666853.1 DUF2752 domain-containing protein [Mucilaginibacter boryungensis]
MLINTLFCSHLSLIKWLQTFLIPCPFKKLTGIDCPGCGFQRSFLALLQGDISKSFQLYPATIPLLLVTLYTIIDARWSIDRKDYLKKTLYIGTAAVIIVSYVVKMSKIV